MRPIWRGTVSFGLVSIAVNLYSATEDKDVRFHQVHSSDGGRIRYRKFCELEEKEVPAGEIAKGYKLPSGDTVILEKEDFDNLPLATTHAIDVLEFVAESDIDPIYYAKAYYLEPNRSSKPYALLRDALIDSRMVGIVKVALRQREQLATLRTRGDVLVLNTMLWPDEVRSPDFKSLTDMESATSREMDMAKSLIDSMTSEELDLSKYHDDYREALQKVIDAKASHEAIETPEPPEEGDSAQVIDLMSALERSMKRAQSARGKTKAAEGQSSTTDKKTSKKAAKKTAKKAQSKRKAS